MIRHKLYYKIISVDAIYLKKPIYLPIYRLAYRSFGIMTFTQAYADRDVPYKYNTEGISWKLVERQPTTSVSILRSPVYFHVMKLYNENKELFNL